MSVFGCTFVFRGGGGGDRQERERNTKYEKYESLLNMALFVLILFQCFSFCSSFEEGPVDRRDREGEREIEREGERA